MEITSDVVRSKHDIRRSDRYIRQQEEREADQRHLLEMARHVSVEWLATLSRWDLYATFTYDPMRSGYAAGHDSLDRRPPTWATCERHLAAYIANLSTEIGRDVCAVAALEDTRAMWPHWHALLGMDGCDVEEFKAASRLWYAERGYCLLSRVAGQDTTHVAAYIMKYFTKANSSVMLLGPLGPVTRAKQLRFTRLRNQG